MAKEQAKGNEFPAAQRNQTLFGAFGSVLRTERRMEELRGQIKRDFYNGRPTRKFRRLLEIQNRLNAYLDGPSLDQLLRM